MNIIKFLELKQSPAYQQDEDKFKDFPIEYVDANGKLQSGFINDARRWVDEDKHYLEVVVLLEDNTAILLTKTCVAPPDCQINWDAVHCAYELS